jgi:subfamily B ATP-binding cassette protein MsbA
VAAYRPLFTVAVVVFSVAAGLFEGIGLSFILPIIELAQGNINPSEASGLLGAFVSLYELLGVPFTLGYLVLGVILVMVIRFSTSFLVGWLRVSIQTRYLRYLQRTAYHHALDAKVAYFDEQGSDDILNAIVTQAEYASKAIKYTIRTLQKVVLVVAYLTVAMYVAPVLTTITLGALGGLVVLFRVVIEGGDSLGDRVADANSRIQQAAQAGTQGIRDVKLFGLTGELRDKFDSAVDQYTESQIRLGRNETAIEQFYSLSTSVTIFALLYVALVYFSHPLGSLGVFLFAIFRLGPNVSQLNGNFYKLESYLPHLVRTQNFVDELETRIESDPGTKPFPDSIETLRFDHVSFSYDDSGELVVDDVSFSVDRDEFVAFVGQSGAGKSTIASLIVRLYTPDDGQILLNDVRAEEYDLDEWRSRITIVRQDPYIFNDTLRRNVTVGSRNVSQSEVERVCRIARVDEFIGELSNGYDTMLGDQGVRLSGGQRQRVALARALLTDADVLVLDEATSDLDSRLEREVQTAIESMDRQFTVIAIAHRLSTVRNADRIYTLIDGRITETGRHQELIDENGKYAELYAIQSRAN